MKWVDRVVGPILCIALQPWRVLSRRFGRRGCAGSEVREILVIKFWGMGSIVLATPLLAAIRRNYPGARVTVLTFSSNVPIFRAFGIGNRFYDLTIRGPVRFLFQFVRMVWFLRRGRFDLVFDLEFFTRFTAILAFIAGGQRSVGYEATHFWKGNFYGRSAHFNLYRHIVDNFNELGRTAGIEVGKGGLDPMPIPSDVAGKVAALLREAGLDDRRFVVLNPNAGPLALERRWPAGRFVELARRIRDEGGLDVVLVGAPDEEEYVRGIHGEIGRERVHNLAGRLSVPELAALLARSAALVSSDSGPLHLATAMRVPTVSLFGPETPVLYGPRGEGHEILFRNLPCSPCMNVYNAKTVICPYEVRCIREIGAQEVHERLLRVLARETAVRSLVAVGSESP
ncbi:MAG: glycosyltransferase family 9 protein [Planctomycetes bacterium]|nr:glycosyltransferase family 9 protein [Planctomycetota bacterium]